MKTSSIILTVLIGSISLFIVVGAAGLLLSKAPREPDFHDITLSPFQYLIIRRSVNVTIMPSDEPRMSIQRLAENRPEGFYWSQGDTLFIDGSVPEPDAQILPILLHVAPGSLKSIAANNAGFSISNFVSPRLTVHLENSQMRIYGHSGRIGALSVNGVNDSNLNMHDTRSDTLLLHLDKSDARVLSQVGMLKGAMRNHSSLVARNIADFQFKKDSTSRLY